MYVETKDIAFFYSEEKYVYLHTFSGSRYIVDYTLDSLETMLDRSMFFRASRNCIPNIGAIAESSRYFGGKLLLKFSPECPHKVSVSRSRAGDFLKWMDGIYE